MNFIVKNLSVLYLEDTNFKFVFLFHPSCKKIVLCRCQLAENILHFYKILSGLITCVNKAGVFFMSLNI